MWRAASASAAAARAEGSRCTRSMSTTGDARQAGDRRVDVARHAQIAHHQRLVDLADRCAAANAWCTSASVTTGRTAPVQLTTRSAPARAAGSSSSVIAAAATPCWEMISARRCARGNDRLTTLTWPTPARDQMRGRQAALWNRRR